MTSEKETMLNGELYDPTDPELDAVVTENVPDGVVVQGNPATVVEELRGE